MFPLLLRIGISLLPVLLFLIALVLLDSFKLIRLRAVLLSLLAGGLAAGASMLVNTAVLANTGVDAVLLSRYLAPLVEETCKAAYLIFLLRAHRAGFLVDSAIHGFAIGAGFAWIENLYYLQTLNDPNILLWMVRGLGTAIMHGGTTAIFAILAKNASDRRQAVDLLALAPALALAIALHSFFNHFFLSPLVSTIVLLVILPAILILTFQRSEKSTRQWLEIGFDSDRELLDALTDGSIIATRAGDYLKSLRERFPPEVVVDIWGYLHLSLELSIKAKGMLLMREAGFDAQPDASIKPSLTELKYLEVSIGRIGMLALAPFLHYKSQDLWQMHLLKS